MARYIAGYARVSTDHQVERDSLVHQQDALRSYGEASGKEVRLFVDAGVSAKDTERPQLRELMDEIRRGRVEVLVVTKLDRLTRSLRDLVDLYELLSDKEVSLVSLTQSLDTSNPMGRFVFYILGLVAQMEREMTAEREMENMQARARRGKWNGGPTPFGYTSYNLEVRRRVTEVARTRGLSVDAAYADPQILHEAQSHALNVVGSPKTLVVDENEASLVRTIFSLFIERKSLRSVTVHLNSLGIRTRSGLYWATTSVKRVLSNPYYKGTLAYNRRQGYKQTSRKRDPSQHIAVEGAVPAIVEAEVWDQAQNILERNKRLSSAEKRSRVLLSGLVKCRKCGGSMTATGKKSSSGRTYHYYKCNLAMRKGRAVCEGTTIPSLMLEDKVVTTLRELGMRDDMIKEQLAEAKERYDSETQPLMDQETRLQDSLSKADDRVMRLIELYEDGEVSKDEFRRRREQIEDTKAQQEQELAKIRSRLHEDHRIKFDVSEAATWFRTLGPVYDSLDFENRRELLKTVFREITVDDATVGYSVRVFPEMFVLSECTGMDSSRTLA
ncbi:MAG: recombinase family protein [Chloroflexota bacterium]